MTLNIYRFCFSLLCLLFTSLLHAQEDSLADNRKSEAEIKIEDRFVAAKFLIIAGKKNEAIKLLDTLRRESDPSAAIFFELAKLHYDAKDLNQTETNLKSAIRLEPDNVWIRQFEINFHKDLGRYDDAIAALKHLIVIQPKKDDYYNQLVQVQLKKKDPEAALLTLDLKEQNIGFSENTIIKKAEILDHAGRFDEAVSAIQTLVQKYPYEKKYLRLITTLLHSNDKIVEAEPYLKKILELDPHDQDAKLGLLLLSNQMVSKDDYLLTLFPLISNPDVPLDIKIKELLPHVTKQATSRDSLTGRQLIDLCDKLVSIHPNDAKSHAIYGDVLMNNEKVTAAIRQYEKTLTINNRNFLVWEQLMYGLESIDNIEELWRVSSEAIDYFPNQAISYYFNGKALAAKNEYKQAESILDEASMISAGNPNTESRILTVKGDIYLKKKEFAKAMKFTDQAIEVSQNKNSLAFELKGDIYKEQNDVKNALIYWTKSMEMGNVSLKLKDKLKQTNGH